MFKIEDKRELEIVRWLTWEKMILHPEYRADYEKLWMHDKEGNRLAYGLKPDALDYFCEKWNLPYPVDPDTDWEVLANDRPGWLFDEHFRKLDKYAPIRKRLVKEMKWLFPDLFMELEDKTTARFSKKWEFAYKAYKLCEIEGKTEEEAATIIKAESNGKVDLTDDAIHKAKKRVYELIFNEPYTTKRERRKKYAKEIAPCAACTEHLCKATGKVCESMEAWFERVVTLPPEQNPIQNYTVVEESENGDSEPIGDIIDISRAKQEMAAYLAYPTCVFENPKTGDSFSYHSPEAVKVFFHVPRLCLNSVSISKRLGFFYDPEC